MLIKFDISLYNYYKIGTLLVQSMYEKIRVLTILIIKYSVIGEGYPRLCMLAEKDCM